MIEIFVEPAGYAHLHIEDDKPIAIHLTKQDYGVPKNIAHTLAHELGHLKTLPSIGATWAYTRQPIVWEIRAWGYALSKLPLEDWDLQAVKNYLLSYADNPKFGAKGDSKLVIRFISKCKKIKSREEKRC